MGGSSRYSFSKTICSCSFLCTSYFEKLLKAHWVIKNTDNHPPKIHNLVRLSVLCELDMPENMLLFLDKFNDFQLEGRYLDYWNMMYETVNQAYTLDLISQINPIRL